MGTVNVVKTVNLGEAKTRLSELVREIRTGAEPEIIIALDGVPAARIVPIEKPRRRVLGMDAGLFALTPAFDEADAEIAALFNGD